MVNDDYVWKWLVPHCTQSGFADHFPHEMAISLGIYPTFSEKPIFSAGDNMW